MADHGLRPGSSRGDIIDSPVDDQLLVDLAIGDPQAFEPLFTRYWDAVYRYCFYRLDNAEDAEDAAIQVLTNAFSALRTFTDRGNSFRSWLFVIAHNEVVNRQRHRMHHPDTTLEYAFDLRDPAPLPEDLAIAASDIRETRRVLAQLSERPRQVVELRLAGLVDEEISNVLGISRVAVRQAQFRAVAQMRSLMGVNSHDGRSTHV